MEGESPTVVEWISGRKTISLTPEKIQPDACVGCSRNPEGSPQGPASGTNKPQAPESTIDAFCPLCFTGQILHPVELHSRQNLPSSRPCVACGECAARWGELLESKACSVPFPCPLCGCGVDNPSKNQAISTIASPLAAPISLNNPSFSEAAQTHSGAWPWSQCGVCEEEKGVFMCLQCGFALCPGCRATTHDKGRFRQHEVFPVEKAWQHGPRKCSVHPDQMLELFCQTCQECVCITCCFKGSHRGDTVVPLPEIATETKEAMKRRLVALEGAAQGAAAVEQRAKELLPMYDNRLRDVRGQVTSTFAALREALLQRETFLLEQLDASSRRLQGVIGEHVNTAARIEKVLRTSHDGYQQLLGTLNSVSLMNSADRIQGSYDAVFSFLDQRICAVKSFTTKLATQLGDAKTSERLASFSLFPSSRVGTAGTAATNETSLCEYKELLSHLGHLELIGDIESLWSESQTSSEVAAVEHASLGLRNENELGSGSMKTAATTNHLTTDVTSAKVRNKGGFNRGLDIGLRSTETHRGGVRMLAIDSCEESTSSQEGTLQGKMKTLGREWPTFHLPSTRDTQEYSLNAKEWGLTEVVNAQGASILQRKRPCLLNEAADDDVGELSQSSQLCAEKSGLSRLDDERPQQAFARVRLESFFEHNN